MLRSYRVRMNKRNNETHDALFVMMTVLRSLGLLLVLPMMAVMLFVMLIYGRMLVDYGMSERVYPAAAEHVDPTLDGCLVRVSGPLVAAEKSLILRENEEYPDAVAVQDFVGSAACHAEQLSVGNRKVQGLYAKERYPFGYFLHGPAEGLERIREPSGHVDVLKSGVPVTLIARQRGEVLDMADPDARATLGVPSHRYASHVRNRNADFSLESVESAALIALCVYVLLWVLLGFLLRRRRLGWWLGLVGVLLMPVVSCVLCACNA